MNNSIPYTITRLPFYRRLTPRLLFIYTSLISIAILALGTILITTTRLSVEQSLSERNQIVAKRSASEIQIYLERISNLLKVSAEMPVITEMGTFNQIQFINKLKIEYPVFRRVFILDSEGNEITSTAFREHESFNWKQEYFDTAVNKETYHSRVFIGENQLPAMFIVQSIRELGDLAGFLCAEVDLKNIWDLVDSITIGKEGNAFVVSSNGKLIAYKEKKRVFEQEDLSHIDIVTKVIQGEEGTATFNTISGERVIGAYAFIQSLGWGIIIQQPIDEAFALARQQIFQVIIGMVISIIVAVWIGIFMTRRIINPIKDLVIGAQRFADDDLSHRLEVYTNDELGILAEEFNIMATKLTENQQKLRRAERLATLSKFAAMVSHEIRNPLNAISINMQVLKREFLKKKQNVESQLKYYDIVASEVKRVDNMINDFLTLARPPRPNLKRQNLHQVLDEVIISQQARALTQGVRVERRYIEEEVWVNIDLNQIKQVFLNVILNSLEAIQGGGKLIIITQFDFTGTQTSSSIVKPLENSAVYITFQDTGSGIPQDKLKDVFEFYFTTKKTGTGIGLAVARQIVESHRGYMFIESVHRKIASNNSGTHLTIGLPRL